MRRVAKGALLGVSLTACTGTLHLASAPAPASIPAPASASISASAPAPSARIVARRPRSVLKRLEGTWQIVHFQSDGVIPDEAMPLMADMFESLRIRFDGGTAWSKTEQTVEERMSVTIEDEHGDTFRLRTGGNMFDGAACRFLGPDEVEVVDHGKIWPGVSVIRRIPK